MEHWKRILMIRLGQVCVLNQSFSRFFEVFVSFLEIATIVKKRNKFLFDLQRSNSAKTSISVFLKFLFLGYSVDNADDENNFFEQEDISFTNIIQIY